MHSEQIIMKKSTFIMSVKKPSEPCIVEYSVRVPPILCYGTCDFVHKSVASVCVSLLCLSTCPHAIVSVSRALRMYVIVCVITCMCSSLLMDVKL